VCPGCGLARGRSLVRTGQVRCAHAVALGVRCKRELSELWAFSAGLSAHRASQRRSPLDPGEDRDMGRRDRALSAAGRPAWRDVEYGVRIINDPRTRRPGLMRRTSGMTNRPSWSSTSRPPRRAASRSRRRCCYGRIRWLNNNGPRCAVGALQLLREQVDQVAQNRRLAENRCRARPAFVGGVMIRSAVT